MNGFNVGDRVYCFKIYEPELLRGGDMQNLSGTITECAYEKVKVIFDETCGGHGIDEKNWWFEHPELYLVKIQWEV